MTTSTPPARGGSDRETRTARRLVWLLFARLALALVIFGSALGLDWLGLDLPEEARHGLYVSIAFAFLATAISGAGFLRFGPVRLLAALQLPVDVAIVSALVHFTGGSESVFVFLYALVTVYGAILFERRGAFSGATLSAVGYGAVLLAANLGWLVDFSHRPVPTPLAMLGAVWGVQVGALYLVGALASVLARELRRTGEALDQKTSDLHRLQDLYQCTVESIMSGLLTIDGAGRITSFNPEAERITGIPAADVMGRDLEHVIPGAGEMMVSPSGRGVGHRARISHRNRAGTELHLGLAGSILKDAEGHPVGHVLIFQDVTKVVEMEGELRRSERLAAVGELSAKIAHEIRNPLAAISGSIEILRANLTTPGAESEPGRLMGIAVRETERLDALIGDFLRYARPRPLVFEPVAVDELVGEVLDMFESSRPEKVELQSDLRPVMAEADAAQLRQVLWNLCLNGVQAMPEGGCLRVHTRAVRRRAAQGVSGAGRNGPQTEGTQPLEDWVEIVIQDEGIGIAADVREQIFEPFFTTRPEGTGLGLPTVHRIVESHGGALQIESAEGQGTTVRIHLPANPQAGPAEAESEAS
ncbi:MAG: ATP-binding protein [Proteobacteria bacterium]|nr:ATP-binding protein [Pseudomonadota bacterium]